MEADTLVEVAPLTKGQIRNRRKEIKVNLVRYILNRRHQSGSVSPSNIAAISEQYTGIQINESEAAEALEILCEKK